jgi:hypothetical protein
MSPRCLHVAVQCVRHFSSDFHHLDNLLGPLSVKARPYLPQHTPADMNQQCYTHRLPDEHLVTVFEHLPIDGNHKAGAVLPYMQVCSRWTVRDTHTVPTAFKLILIQMLLRPLLFRSITFEDDEDLTPFLEALDSITARGIDTSSWIRDFQFGTSWQRPLSEKDISDLVRILGQARTLRRLVLHPLTPPAVLLAVPARTCADTLKELHIFLNTAALADGAVAYINMFQNLQSLHVTSFADWSTCEPLCLPRLARTSWRLVRVQGSAHELDFLSLCQFGQLVDFGIRLHNSVIVDSPRNDFDHLLPFSRFALKHPNISVAAMNLPHPYWAELVMRAPGITTIRIQDDINLTAQLATILPPALKHLHIAIRMDTPSHNALWPFLTQLAQCPCRSQILDVHVSIQGGRLHNCFQWHADPALEEDTQRNAFIGRLLGHALRLIKLNILVLDPTGQSVASTRHPDASPAVQM